MISRSGKKNFLAAHYEWLALGLGVLALIGAALFYVSALGEDPEETAAAARNRVSQMKPSATGVKDVDMTAYAAAMRGAVTPATVAEVSEKGESFLASERRVLCKKCGKAIVGNVKTCPKCPYCGEQQEEEAKVVLDADGDGLPDEWEKKYGLNPGDGADAAADTDGDGFTNFEEFEAKTDPTDAKDHPDYLDSLTIQLPLKETYMPFVFTKATPIPSGSRCEFYDAKQVDFQGRGLTMRALVGEDIGKSGFKLKDFQKKEEKRAIAGGKGMFKTVDVSEAVVVRKSDGKEITLVLSTKDAKPAAVDIQAALVYVRGETKNIDVVPGSEIDLNGTKYKIKSVQSVGKGAKVSVENVATGKVRVLEALER